MSSGKFTKKYKNKNKYIAMQERIEFWLRKHGREKTKRIMQEQGIV